MCGGSQNRPIHALDKERKEDSTKGLRKLWDKVKKVTMTEIMANTKTVAIKSNAGKSHFVRGERHWQEHPLLHQHNWPEADQSPRF